MKNFIITLFLISLISFSIDSKAQTQKDFDFFLGHASDSLHKVDYRIYTKNNKNELQLVFSSFFLFYKEVFSSQDSFSCSFTPSCSEYAVQTVKKKGILIGMCDTFDRLLRCNSLSPEHYHIDIENSLLIDPVK